MRRIFSILFIGLMLLSPSLFADAMNGGAPSSPAAQTAPAPQRDIARKHKKKHHKKKHHHRRHHKHKR